MTTKTELMKYTLKALKEMADEKKITLPEKCKKATIIDLILNPQSKPYTVIEISYLKIEGDSLQYKDSIKALEGSIWAAGTGKGFWLVPVEHKKDLEDILAGKKQKIVEIVSEEESGEEKNEKSDEKNEILKKMTGKDESGNVITLEIVKGDSGDIIVIEGKAFKIKDKIKKVGGKWDASKKHWSVKSNLIDFSELFTTLGLKK